MPDPAKPPPAPAPQGTPGAPGEPSMEEILASIRRILSEDEQAAAASAGGEQAPPAEAKGDDGVLQLTEAMLAPAPPAAPEHASAPGPAAAAALPPPPSPRPPPAPPFAFQPAPAPPAPAADAAGEGLLAAGATAAAAAALGQLARPAAERAATAPAWPVGTGGLTVEEIVRQELRPLLSAWLNANLPRVVEEAVARELERVRARIG